MLNNMLNTFLDKYTVFLENHREFDYFLSDFYITPFFSVLFYLPIFLALLYIHKKLIAAGFKHNPNVYKFRFHAVNTIVNGGLYTLLIQIAVLSHRITSPTIAGVAEAEYVGLILITAIIYAALVCTIPLWYKTGSRILLCVYVLFAIFTLYHCQWFIGTFLCIMIPVMKYLRGKYKQTEKPVWGRLHVGSVILFILGIVRFVDFEIAELFTIF